MTAGGNAAIQQAGNVGMLEAGHQLPFVFKTAQKVPCVPVGTDNLDGNLPLEKAVGAFSEVDRTHTPRSQQPDQPVGTEAVAWHGGGVFVFRHAR